MFGEDGEGLELELSTTMSTVNSYFFNHLPTYSFCVCRSIHDPVPPAAGPGGNSSPSSGVRHRTETEEGKRRSLEVHQSVFIWSR